MSNLKLTNTLTKKIESFSPLHNNKVSLYVCGVTPYDKSHIGHGRCYVVFDVLYRLLKLLGYDVSYIRNFTDIDDKLIHKEHETGTPYKEIADQFIKSFHEDMDALGCLDPSAEPRVTDNIPEIIQFIENLVEKKFAYVVGNDVYFDISKYPDYGKLSGKKIEDLISGARVEVNEKKRNSGDFALWKGNDEHKFWESPWGHGRPGWHIECSALAKKFLKDTIDIHGGGMDLIFPHHENEIAQSESHNNKPLSRYWVHNAFVNINREKMSKSLGNIFTLQDIFEQFNPMVLRYYFLQHHYKTPIDFSIESLNSVEKAYKKLLDVFSDVDATYDTNDITTLLEDALCDDLNTPKMLGVLFENLDNIKAFKDVRANVKGFLINATGLTFEKYDEVVETPEILRLIDEREEARINKDWKRADEIRDKLIEMGVSVQDKKIK